MMTLKEAYETLNLTEILIPEKRKNRPGGKYKKISITIHNTSNRGFTADAMAHSKYLNENPDSVKRRVSWHYTVDSKEVVKHLPISEISWHTSHRYANRYSISIEICMNDLSKQSESNDRAALLAAILMKSEGIKKDKIKRHRDWTGKPCPELILSDSKWEDFLNRIDYWRNQIG
jgi:N-acetylmuramoyl-L-alanine amidase